MIRMVTKVEECTGTFRDIKASEMDRHWCDRCNGTGWVVVGEPFQVVWEPLRWAWLWHWRTSLGRWVGMVQVKQHD